MPTACLILALGASLFAQVPPGGMAARELLASNDPAKLAWGAEYAARSGQAEFVPQLLPLLNSEDERVQEHALDALIRLKAKVPPEELQPLLSRFEEAAIVLGTANRQRDFLLSMLRENRPYDAAWVALNEALIEIGGEREYWAAVLREWTISVAIYIVDPGRRALRNDRGITHFCGDGLGEIRPGFPPRVVYSLTLLPKAGDTLLDSGPHAVYYRRHSSTSMCGTRIDRDDYRGDFVASVVRETEPVAGHMTFDVVWQSDAGYAAEVERLRNQTLAGVQEIVDWMMDRHLLSPEDAAMKPHIALGIEDQRTNKAHDLPATRPWE